MALSDADVQKQVSIKNNSPKIENSTIQKISESLTKSTESNHLTTVLKPHDVLFFSHESRIYFLKPDARIFESSKRKNSRSRRRSTKTASETMKKFVVSNGNSDQRDKMINIYKSLYF